MAWTSLRDSLNSKPRVLAGPILRKVTPKSVTVWLALRTPGSVTLSVQDDQQNRVMQGTRKTVAIGKNLHVVAVTAKPVSLAGDLAEGIVYRYDLVFDFDDNLSTNLATATRNAPLNYQPFTLPSFALPPRDPNLLQLIHGSCRMPHAEGKDTFPLVDDLIAQSASNASARPHQLLLMGDQIYADDVSDILSLLLADAGDALLGWTEQYMSTVPLPGTPRSVLDLHPDLRESFLREGGFTSVDLRYHLIGLGEYLSMYLFVWSDVLWPSTPATLPTFEELAAAFSEKISAMDQEILGGMVGLPESRRGAVKRHTAALQEFRNTLPKVRRALANIPSYMIFDDHEVTDDWNMTRNFCRDLYGRPLGLRIVQNALVAYALCQHWGNAPEQFEDSALPPAGLDLLRLLDTPTPAALNQKAAGYDQQSERIRSLLGVPKEEELRKRQHNALYHDPHSLEYHFTVEGPGHQVIFTDTRTWRSFPNGGNETSEIFPKEQFKRQILDAPATGDRVLLVVLSTNAPPTEPIRAATRYAGIAKTFEHFPDVYEAWEIPSTPFDRLLKTLTDKLPLDSNRHRVGQVILLSGDVHHSFATRLIYRATSRFEDATPQPATAVFAQLVASPFKKETEGTRGLHREGYTYAPKKAKLVGLIRPHEPLGYVGWNIRVGSPRQDVGSQTNLPPRGSPGNAYIRLLKFNEPTTVELTKPDTETELSRIPDYRYRLDYLLPTQQQVQLNAPPMPAMPVVATAAGRKQAAEAFRAATARYRMYNTKAQPKVVGVNNFGEITFNWSAGPDKQVNHTLRWWNNGSSKVALTTYTVSLNPNDPSYKDLKAKVEP